VRDDEIIGRGHNQRVQKGDPITHAEIDCLRNAGRIGKYADTILYSTLMPCYLCAGAVVQFGIPKVIVGEARTFSGAEAFMRSHNVESEIWQRLADNLPFGLKKKYIQVLVNRLRKFEIDSMNTYDAHVPITSRDEEWFVQMGNIIPTHAIPTGIQPNKYLPDLFF